MNKFRRGVIISEDHNDRYGPFCHSGRWGASIYIVVSNLVVYRDVFQLRQCYRRWLRIPMLPRRNHDSRHCRNEVAWCS